MRLALILAALAFAAPALADVDERPDNLEACLAAADGVTMDVDFCLGDEAERLEPKMATAYDAAMRIAEEGQRAGLEQSQKAFLAYRETFCEAKAAVEGSGHSQYGLNCTIRLTRDRIRELEGFDNP